MSDYRRLISYIYEYEGKEKGKNVGFVKLEARNGQCRLNLSVKKVYMGGSAIGVFLLSKAGTEVFLGNIFIRNGAGEFRAVVDAKNVEGAGGGLDTYYGLTIHDVKNSWRSYTTIWEDAVEPETLPGSLPGNQGNGDTVKMLPAQEVLPGALDQSEEEPVVAVASVVREIEAEIAREEERRSREETVPDPAPSIPARPAMVPEPSVMPAPEELPPAPPVPEELPGKPPVPSAPEELPGGPSAPSAPEELPGGPSAPSAPEELPGGPSAPSAPESLPGKPAAPKEIPGKAEATVSPEELPPASGVSPSEPIRRILHMEEDPPAPQAERSPSGPVPAPGPDSGQAAPEKDASLSRSPELENPEVLRYLQETEDVTADPEKLWQELRKSYPKIQPFDYESGCEILTIRPQDIGRLPRESWVYGNNSFLLHGYYNFRYIILFRLGNKDGRARYLIGVPGHYYSSEKYMASMFGFPNFVLSKKQPPNDGRFGYWYTDIRVR